MRPHHHLAAPGEGQRRLKVAELREGRPIPKVGGELQELLLRRGESKIGAKFLFLIRGYLPVLALDLIEDVFRFRPVGSAADPHAGVMGQFSLPQAPGVLGVLPRYRGYTASKAVRSGEHRTCREAFRLVSITGVNRVHEQP